tara:strand:- start:2639 stop:3346 length:708 start_codon:yes stop_codon:yes gene_type:complete
MTNSESFKLSIIVPAYNEGKTILTVLQKLNNLKKFYQNIQIIVINDGSKDNSLEILESNKSLFDILINNPTNRGKGNAVKKGLEVADGDYITFQDADLEYDPEDFKKFINLINMINPDLIIGSRFNYADYSRSHYILNKIGNKFMTFLFNIIYDTTFTDIYSCYACFKKNLLINETLKTDGFEQHAEILCKVVKNGKKFYEVPINYHGRSHDEGKKIKFYHIFSVIFQILLGRFK